VWAVARPVGTFVATLVGAVVLVHLLLVFAPGDAIDSLPNADEVRAVLAAEWHLDQSPPMQIVSYLADIATGDLRTSLVYRPGMPVVRVIAGPALRSLGILVTATLLAVLGGTTLAWLTAGRRSLARPAVWAVSIVPVFLIARLAVAALNAGAWSLMEAGWIARPGWFALPLEDHPLRWALAVAILAVGSGALAEVHAEVESLLVRIRSSGYVDAARARGAPVWPHVLRNLLPPLSTVTASRAAFFVGGLVILEQILLLNGVGAILWRAALERDYPLALGITLVTAAAVAAARLIGDLIRTGLDPRRRERP
jgi:ABC-type dipeptide/oligopeptide/nickel transport system permease component